ncbi:MAG: tRNA pseudouridine(38-40) synthase TruA [Simkaniaceae bacterium]
MPEQTYKLTISYDGTNYCGWQSQPNGVAVQELIQKALSTILRQPLPLIGSGRTDAGVHALGQTAHFRTNVSLEKPRLLKSLNGLLPKDIRVLSVQQMPNSFHARYSAIGKTYRYHLRKDPVPNPFTRLYSHHVPFPLDMDLLHSAAKIFIGTHNFAAFANEAAAGSAAKNPVRTIYSLDIKTSDAEIILEIKGNGFLYKMVRNIVGTLLETARGKFPLEQIPLLFEKQDRRLVPKPAPASGLFLVNVAYPKSMEIL